jgi:hypothetical protein
MPPSGILRRVAVVRNVSEERSASIIRVTIDELGTLAVTSNRGTPGVFHRSVHRLLVTVTVVPRPILVALMLEALRSSGTSVRNIKLQTCAKTLRALLLATAVFSIPPEFLNELSLNFYRVSFSGGIDLRRGGNRAAPS